VCVCVCERECVGEVCAKMFMIYVCIYIFLSVYVHA